MAVDDILSRLGPITVSEKVEEKPTCPAMDMTKKLVCGGVVGDNDKCLCDKHYNAYLPQNPKTPCNI